MKYYIGIDVGTSGTKTVIFDRNGQAIKSSYQEYPLYQEQNGYAEQDPLDWWNAVCKTLKDVLKGNSYQIGGIGISGQMHGLVMLDKDGNVLRKSIIWCDQRTVKECDELENIVGRETLINITGSPALTGFTASKILWVKNNEREIFDKCAHVLLPKDYIRYMLSGVYATEVSDAAGMQVFDVKERQFSEKLIQAVGLTRNHFGTVYESSDITAYTNENAHKLTGIDIGVPIVGGAGDNAAAAIGTGTVLDGDCFTTIGTSGVVFCHTSNFEIDKSGRAHSFCAAVNNEWHMMGVTQAAGLSLKWFKETCCKGLEDEAKQAGMPTYMYLDTLALNSGIGGNRLIYLPYLMGERTPHLDPNARGVFFGLSAMHTIGDMARAVLEGVGFSLLDAVNVLRESGANINSMTLCGGGAKSDVWCQIISDIMGINVTTLQVTEGPALGVAILAMVGAKEYPDVKTASKSIVQKNKEYTCSKENHEIYLKYYEIYKDIYRNTKNDFEKLSNIK